MDDPANERVFEFPSSVRLFLLPVALVCGVIFLFEIFQPSVHNLALEAVAILVGGMQLRTFSHLRYRIAVSDDGIRYMPHGDSPIFLQWSEIANLELRERLGDARLVISDATRLRQMNLDYRLDRFQDLLSFVADHATNCDPHPPLPSSFHIGYLEQTVVVIVFFVSIGGSIYFMRTGQSINAYGDGARTVRPDPGCHARSTSTQHDGVDGLDRHQLSWLEARNCGRIGKRRALCIERGSRGSVWTVVWLDRLKGGRSNYGAFPKVRWLSTTACATHGRRPRIRAWFRRCRTFDEDIGVGVDAVGAFSFGAIDRCRESWLVRLRNDRLAPRSRMQFNSIPKMRTCFFRGRRASCRGSTPIC